jgi:hypothetical protein
MHQRLARILSALGLSSLVLLSYQSGSADTTLPSPGSASPETLDFDALAEALANQTKEVEIRAEDLPPLPKDVAYKHPKAIRLPGNLGSVQPLLKCDTHRCIPRVVRAVEKNGSIDAQARVELPALSKKCSEFEFRPLGLLDIDQDGKEELLVRYDVYAPERQGAGALWTEMLAIVNLPEMTLAMVHELKSGGREGIDNRCQYQVTRLHFNDQRHLALRWSRTCECVDKKGCHAGAAPPEDYIVDSKRRIVLLKEQESKK